jgi:hypothetical protein
MPTEPREPTSTGSSTAPPSPVFTVESVHEGLKLSARGADELNKQLADQFTLSGLSALLRLR